MLSALRSPLPAPSPDSASRIAIIGGGISGLAAAHRLTELLPHAQLALFEASNRLGGVLETMHADGFLIERSADNFLTQPPAAVELCRRLGLADDLLPTDDTRRRAFVVKGGKLLPIPNGFYLMSPRKLCATPHLAAIKLVGQAAVAGRTLRLRGPASSPSPLGRGQNEGALGQGEDVLSSDESVASFARRRLGREAYERLVQPLVAGIYTADPEQLSMAATMPQFLEYERQHGSLLRATLRMPWSSTNRSRRTGHFSDQSTPDRSPATSSPDTNPDRDPTQNASGARYSLFAAPRNGMTSLVNALAARLPPGTIHLNTPVTSITSESDNRWRLNLPLPSGEGRGEGHPQRAG